MKKCHTSSREGGFMVESKAVELATSWEFQSLSEVDLNPYEVAQDMSRKNPIILVTRGEGRWVFVDASLMVKFESQDEVSGTPDYAEGITFERFQIFRIENDFSEWVNWAKVVKAADWAIGKEDGKQTVQVFVPVI